jgi:hypothetical protein
MKYLDWILDTQTKGLRASASSFKPDNKIIRDTIVPRVICNDGAYLSVQAGDGMYCAPRDNFPGWYEVEVGFPSCTPPDSWIDRFDGMWYTNKWDRFKDNYYKQITWNLGKLFKPKDNGLKYYDSYWEFAKSIWRSLRRAYQMAVSPIGTDSVYAYLDVDLVREFIDLHGGEDTEACFAQLDPDPRPKPITPDPIRICQHCGQPALPNTACAKCGGPPR